MDTETPSYSQDVASTEALVNALYACVSGPAGRRDWPRFRNLFMSSATLAWPAPIIPPRVTLLVMTVEQFVQNVGPSLSATETIERELGRREERFNHIAHVFSTYEARSGAEGAVSRGINSLQLFWDGQRWWITNVIWDFEGPGSSIPDTYLQRA
jgi:hypothetical protein